jgi:hypothetical protein
MTVTVNGSLCGSDQYANQPCTSVTICQPGTENCQTINNILLDTGSYGLRIFSSVITVNLTAVTNGTANVAECVQFGDGSSEWGQVKYADVVLGNEPAVEAPIEVINSTYATPPAACSSSQSTPDTSPAETGFNGILGVGLFNQDCGTYCTNTANNGQYFNCTGTTCTSAKAPVQVQNPVALLPTDNNGVVLKLPAVGTGGAASATGSLFLGIGTQTNNTPSGVSTYTANGYGEFTTTFSNYSSTPVSSFIDSGSSILFVPTIAALPDCNTAAGGSHGSTWSGWDCPANPQNLAATNISSAGAPSGAVSFQIANAYNQFENNPNSAVFMNIGGSSGSSAYFDWGLPFFFGRNVYVGIESTKSTLGTGPYWAY